MQELLFLNKVQGDRNAFEKKVKSIAFNIGIDPNELMFIMDFETAGTFSPSIKNPGSSATGLIGFLDSTARDLGTTVEELRKMSALKQLSYVEKYFLKQKYRHGAPKDFVDTYLAVLYPISTTKDDSYRFPSDVVFSNPIFDLNKDKILTKGELRKFLEQRVYQTVPTQYYDIFFKKKELFCSHIKRRFLEQSQSLSFSLYYGT